MGIDSAYGDDELKEKGKWFDFKGTEARIKIASFQNSEMAKFMRENLPRESGGPRGMIEDNTGTSIDDEELNDLVVEGIAKYVVRDWQDVTVDDGDLADELNVDPGDEIKCTEANVQTLLEAVPELQVDITNVALDRSQFQREQKEADKKN